MANLITCIRIVCGIVLLFFPAFSPPFYVLYIMAGISDMVDGAVARKTGTVSEFGAKLDSVADLIFVASCLIKLLPVIQAPLWLIVWILVIAVIRLDNLIFGYVTQKELIALHTAMNKVTGILLFLLPLTITFIDLAYSGAVVCVIATVASIQEVHRIRAGLKNSSLSIRQLV